MNTQFISAINQIAEEKNIPKEVILETVEAALAAAYRKDYGERDQEVRVKINEETGELKAFVSKEVVKEVENDNLEISLEEAKKVKADAKLEDLVEIEDTPTDFGRIAAQTAKQVIIQRIREAERDIVFAEYKDKEGQLVNAQVQRIEGNTVIVDLGQASGVLFSNEQIHGERYYIAQRLKVYIVKVEQSTRGPQVVVSRSHPGVIKKLFETEVPEIETGIVEIKAIAREAGYRTKMAVHSNDENVDPVGSCVGQRGIRVQAVMAEIGEEKIDVIPFSEDQKEFISNALSPAKVMGIDLDDEEKKAKVLVKEDQLSLAIGKNGQNVRLAAKLTGWNIDINVKEGDEPAASAEGEEDKSQAPESEDVQTTNVSEEKLEEKKIQTETEIKTDEPGTTEELKEEVPSEGEVAEEIAEEEAETPEDIVEEALEKAEDESEISQAPESETEVDQATLLQEESVEKPQTSEEKKADTEAQEEVDLANEIEANENEQREQ